MTTPAKSPVVSVVIPTYNRAHLLGRALRSVLAQTFQDFEVIVVDDASTDNSEEIVNAFQDARVRYLRHESNRGGSAARNTGIRAANGQYVAFQDSDDEWLPEKLAIQLEVFKTSDLERLGVVTCPLFTAYEGRQEVTPPETRDFARGWVYKELLFRLLFKSAAPPWGTQALVVKREALTEANLFDESLPQYQDWDFVLRLSRHWQVESVETPLVIYHQHSGPSIYQPASTSMNTARRDAAGTDRIVSKYYNELAAEPAALARTYYRLARLYFRTGDMTKCRQNVSNALRHRRNQRFFRARLLYVLTLLPGNVRPYTRRAMAAMAGMKSRLRRQK